MRKSITAQHAGISRQSGHLFTQSHRYRRYDDIEDMKEKHCGWIKERVKERGKERDKEKEREMVVMVDQCNE